MQQGIARTLVDGPVGFKRGATIPGWSSTGAIRFPGGHQKGSYISLGSSTGVINFSPFWTSTSLGVINFSPCWTSTSPRVGHQLLWFINFVWGHQQGSSTSSRFGHQLLWGSSTSFGVINRGHQLLLVLDINNPPFWTSTSLGHQLLQILDISFSLLWTSTSLGHQTSLRLPKLLPTRHLGWKQIHYE